MCARLYFFKNGLPPQRKTKKRKCFYMSKRMWFGDRETKDGEQNFYMRKRIYQNYNLPFTFTPCALALVGILSRALLIYLRAVTTILKNRYKL